MKANAVILALLSFGTFAFAYNGSTTITKQSEKEHGIEFDVRFQERQQLLQISVTAPKKVKSLLISKIELSQLGADGKPTLVVPIASAGLRLSITRQKLTVDPEFEPIAEFSVSRENLPKTRLHFRYGGFDSGWTYIVDLASYMTALRINKDEREVLQNYHSSPAMVERAARICLKHGLTKAEVLENFSKTMRSEVAEDHITFFYAPSQVLTLTFDAEGRTLTASLLGKVLNREDPAKLFEERYGPIGSVPKSDWRPTGTNRDKIVAAVKTIDREAPDLGKADWLWNEAEIYIDSRGHYLFWVHYQSRNRGKVWRWIELDDKAKFLKSGGWGEG